MSRVAEQFRRWMGGKTRIEVRLLLKGRVGPGWLDEDRRVRLPIGATLDDLVAAVQLLGVPIQEALDQSPHLRHTLLVNGERRPLDQYGALQLEDGDEVYLLSPFSGG